MGFDDHPTDEMEERAGIGLAEPPLIASGRLLGGRYRLRRPLGHGGMAIVWLAADERLGREVAVKVLSDTLTADPEYLGRFRREAKLAARLQHPNLVSVYDFAAGERPYLVMEYVDGGDLAARLEAGDAPDTEDLARGLLAALSHIHAAGVLHRDIKPQNVLVDGQGSARLTDFGIAQPRDATSLTRAGHVIGTESYLAPEVMAGDAATESSDLYALGVVLADAAREGAPAALWGLTDRMRDPVPGRRPGSAASALAELEQRPIGGEPTQPYAIEPATEHGRPPRVFEPSPTGSRVRSGHRGRVAAVVALGVLAVVAAIAVALGSGGDGGGATPGGAPGASKSATGGDDGSTANADQLPASSSAAADQAATGDSPSPSDDHASAGDGATLNDQGFALLGEGNYAEAVPVLERAVDALRDSGDQATYNYALYNLGTAYLGAGRPEDAIVPLEQRMSYDDGQLDQVRAALDRAYAAAGEQPGKPKPEKPGNGPKSGGVPPPFEGE